MITGLYKLLCSHHIKKPPIKAQQRVTVWWTLEGETSTRKHRLKSVLGGGNGTARSLASRSCPRPGTGTLLVLRVTGAHLGVDWNRRGRGSQPHKGDSTVWQWATIRRLPAPGDGFWPAERAEGKPRLLAVGVASSETANVPAELVRRVNTRHTCGRRSALVAGVVRSSSSGPIWPLGIQTALTSLPCLREA